MKKNNPHLAITGWDIISATGTGKEEFTRGMQTGCIGIRALDKAQPGNIPLKQAALITEFDITKHLGKKGTRGMDRLGALVTATAALLFHSTPQIREQDLSGMGFVMGTSNGCLKSQLDFIRESLIQESPDWVDPLLFPKSVMNSAAGQAGIWHKITGMNATVAGGYLSCYAALQYAAALIQNGHAEVVLAGCAEDFSAYTAWKYQYNCLAAQYHTTPGEASTLFAVEDYAHAVNRGAEIYAQILCQEGIYSFAFPDTDAKNTWLTETTDTMLAACGIGAEKIGIVCSNIEYNTPGSVLQNCYPSVFSVYNKTAQWLPVNPTSGDCQSAAAGVQLAYILAAFSAAADREDNYALLITEGDTGAIGCALIKKG